jgi:hypothetical protein
MLVDLPPNVWTSAHYHQLQAPLTIAISMSASNQAIYGAIIPTTSQVARPGHLAEREELDAALKAGTIERLRLFIDRHPGSRYRQEAEAAMRRFEKLRKP